MKKQSILLAIAAAMSLVACAEETPAASSSDSTPSISSDVSSSESPDVGGSSSESEVDVPVSSSSSEEIDIPGSSTSSDEPGTSSEEPGSSSSSEEIDVPGSSSSSEEVEEPDSSSSSSSEEPAPVTYAISVNAGNAAGITVDAPEVSEADVFVYFTVTNSDDTIKIDRVLANDVVCGRDASGDYYFLMPAGAVTITVVTSPVAEETAYAIINDNADAASILGASASHLEGEDVEFRVSMKAGWDFVSVSAYVAGDGDTKTPVEITELDGVYSFEMPGSDVHIAIEATRATFKVTYDSTYGTSNISSLSQFKVDGEYDETVRNGFVEYGATVTVTLRDTDYKLAKGIHIVESDTTIMAAEGSTRVSFVMPHYNITLEAVAEDYYRPIATVNSENLTVKAYALVEDQYVEISEAIYNSTVYVKVEGENDDIAIDTLTYSWGTSYNQKGTLTSKNDDGYYHFTMPDADSDTTITVTEKNMAAWRGYSFLGSYIGRNIDGTNLSYTGVTARSSDSYSSTFTSDGSFRYRSDDYKVASVDGEPTDANGVIHATRGTSSGYIFAYSERVLFTSYGGTSLTNDDNVLMVKKLNDTDENSIYTMDYITIGSESYMMGVYYREGEVYAGFFVDPTETYSPNYCLDAEFEFISGTKITDTDAEFKVKNGLTGETICTVSSVNGTRTIIDEVRGTYTNTETGDLYLDGDGTATYNGSSWAYTYEGNVVTLTSGANSVTITIDPIGMTYVVTATAGAANDYHGYSYSGSWSADDDPDWPTTFTLVITFVSATEVTIQVPTYSGYYVNATGTYVIDEVTGVITITYDFDGSTGKTMTLTPNDDKSQLTVGGDIDYRYLTDGTTISKN